MHRVRPFKKEDITAFEPMEEMLGGDMLAEIGQEVEDSGLAVTLVRNGEIVACGGVHPVNEIQGEAWLRISKKCSKFRREIARWIFRGHKIVEETYGFKQLFAVILDEFVTARKVVERLGYEIAEERVTNGRTYIVYTKMVS